MNTFEEIRSNLKEAMRAKDALLLNTLRGMLSAFTNELVSKGRTPQDVLTEEEVITVIRRLAKQRKESADQYTAAGRNDLAETEIAELALISKYLPAPLTREELEEIVKEEVALFDPLEQKHRGQLIGAIMKRSGGNVDQGMLQELLNGYFS